MNPHVYLHVYLHETIDIVGQGRAAYHHLTANFARQARERRGLHCVGVFSTVGSNERWPGGGPRPPLYAAAATTGCWYRSRAVTLPRHPAFSSRSDS